MRQIDRTYDVAKMRDTLREALTTPEPGPKVIVASSECMLNKQRRVKPLFRKAVASGERMVRERFGVDEDVCTGDHACIRLSGCPSLSVKHTDDPLQGRSGRRDRQQLRRLRQLRRGGGGGGALPVVLSRRHHPQSDRWDRLLAGMRGAVIGFLQRRREAGASSSRRDADAMNTVA